MMVMMMIIIMPAAVLSLGSLQRHQVHVVVVVRVPFRQALVCLLLFCCPQVSSVQCLQSDHIQT